MPRKFKDYLYFWDLVSSPPRLRIFNEDNYKSIFSSILSIVLIVFSVVFTVFSLIDFLKYKYPVVAYSKDNDKETNRTILLKDTLIILALIESNNFTRVNKSIAYFEAEMRIEHKNKTTEIIPLTIENCEFGKNIDRKYMNSLNEIQSGEIDQYYCFSKKDGNFPLFYNPNLGESSVYLYSKINEESNYNGDDLMLMIINGNDIIDHGKKNHPISDNYFTMAYTSFSTFKFTLTNYYFQFIKYESDEGLFFPNSKTHYAKAFSHMTNIFTNYFYEGKPSHIGTTMIQISKVNFDSYKRSYSRLQSLLAEIMSVISLLFGIGEVITDFLLRREMSRDIVNFLISKNLMYKINSDNEEINNSQKYQIIEDSLLDLTNQKNNSEKVTIKNENPKKENKTTIDSEKSKKNNFPGNAFDFKQEPKISQDKIDDINYFETVNRLNYCNVLLSYLCCKNDNSKIIKLGEELVDEDLSVENILSRIYELENVVNILLKKEQINYKVNEHEKFKEISKCIYEIEKKNLNKKG